LPEARDFYETEVLWTENYWTEVERDRAQHTMDHLPEDVTSALDIGCGAGIVSREIAKRVARVVALDFARNPLRQVHGLGIPAIQANAVRIPFRDAAFDLVMATEVVEHLGERERREALREFARVSRRYVLLTVPYREVLQWHWAKCAECGFVFHVTRHTQSYNERILAGLLDGFALTRTWTFGPREKRIPAFLILVGQAFGGYARVKPGYAMCPRCGNNLRFVSRTNLGTHVVLGVPDRILPLPRHPAVIAALFTKAWE